MLLVLFSLVVVEVVVVAGPALSLLSTVSGPDAEVLLESFLEIVSATGFTLRTPAKVDAKLLLLF